METGPDTLHDLVPVVHDLVQSIVATPFDTVLSGPAVLLSERKARDARAQFTTSLADTARAGRLAEFGRVVRDRDAVRLVFSKETVGRLTSGELKIPIDKATGLSRAEARDSAGRIREGARFESMGRGRRLLRGVVAAAHVVSALDIQAQLERLDAKLDRLIGFQQADRVGELRGVYLSLQKGLTEPDPVTRRAHLLGVSARLDDLQSRFLQTARAELNSIRNPNDISWFQAIFTLQSIAESDLRAGVGRALGDFRLHHLCSVLGSVVHAELDEPEALATHTRALAAGIESAATLFAEKLGYFDSEAAEAALLTATSIQAVNGSLGGRLDLLRGELALIDGEPQ
jgi:hypothetical protein